MKKRFVSVITLLIIILLSLSVVACGSGKATDNGIEMGVSGDDMMEPESSVNKSEDTTTTTNNSGDGSKIIKTASITAETKEYANSTEQLKALITSVGGHVSNSSSNENASYRTDGKTEKSANYTIKIPSESFDSFISSLSSIFNVTNLSTATQDVSESYFTLQARISTLQAKREGLVSMLQNVDVNTDFTTWQKINAELTEIDTQLNIYNEQLKSLENKVAYSTITLTVREVTELTVLEEKGYGEEILEAFKESGESVVEFFKGLLIMLIYVLPFAIIWGAFVLIVVLIIRFSIKRKKAKDSKIQK